MVGGGDRIYIPLNWEMDNKMQYSHIANMYLLKTWISIKHTLQKHKSIYLLFLHKYLPIYFILNLTEGREVKERMEIGNEKLKLQPHL